jgi:hypothetical protein
MHNMHNENFIKEVFGKWGLFYIMFDQADLAVDDKGEVLTYRRVSCIHFVDSVPFYS